MDATPPRTSAISARSGLAIAVVTALTYVLAIGVTFPASSGALFRVFLIASLVLWPLCYGAHYASLRWTGVTPTPLIDGLLGRGGIRFAAIRAAGGGIYAPLMVILSAVVAVFTEPEVTNEEGVPFAGMDAWETFTANLQIIPEETAFRLLLMFPLVALFGVRNASRRGRVPLGVWIAILVSGLLFGYAHVSVGEMIGADPQQWLIFSLVQKGLVGGGIFGYIAWRRGLEASIMAHYTANMLIVWLGLALGAQP